MSLGIRGLLMDVSALMDYSNYVRELAAAILGEFPLKIGPEELSRKLSEEITRRYLNAISRGTYRSFRDILRDVIRSLLGDQGIVVSFRELDYLASTAAASIVASAQVYPEVPEALSKLHERGFSMCIVTNLDGDIARKMLVTTGLIKYFAGVVSADVVKVPKPNRKIFQAALRRIRCSAAQTLIIGSSFEDVLGGKVSGIKTIYLKRGREVTLSVQPDFSVEDFRDVLRILGVG